MRNSRFADRCFVVVVVLALAALFAGAAFSVIDQEPRATGVSVWLQNFR